MLFDNYLFSFQRAIRQQSWQFSVYLFLTTLSLSLVFCSSFRKQSCNGLMAPAFQERTVLTIAQQIPTTPLFTDRLTVHDLLLKKLPNVLNPAPVYHNTALLQLCQPWPILHVALLICNGNSPLCCD